MAFFLGELMSRPLSYRERRFAELYAVSGKGKQSAIDAGYSVNGADVTAARLLGRARVCEAIEALKPPAVKVEDLITPEYVLEGLRREAEQGETSASRVAALRELGRTLGLFLDKQASIQVSYADELESLQGEIQAAIDERQAKAAVKH